MVEISFFPSPPGKYIRRRPLASFEPKTVSQVKLMSVFREQLASLGVQPFKFLI